MSTQKEARSRAKDPIQEKLRSEKDAWNKACSEFISRVIAFKRGLNGRGDAKYSLPPSKITEPVPVEVGAMLQELSGNYSQIADGAKKIMDSQLYYHNARLERVKQREQKIASTSQYLLISEASSKLTRFWAQLKGRFSFGPFKTERLSMLTLCANLKKDCLDFQNEVATSGADHVKEANTILHKIEIQVKALITYSKSISKIMDTNKQNEDQGTEEQKPELTENSELAAINFIINDLVFAIKLPNAKDLYGNRFEANKILAVIKRFEKEKDVAKKEYYFQELDLLYKNFLKEYSEKFAAILKDKGIHTDLSSFTFKDMFELLQKSNETEDSVHLEGEEDFESKVAECNNDLHKVAHSNLSRWLKNKLNKLNPSSATSSLRVNLFDSTEEFKATLNDLMDMLEKEIQKDTLIDLTSKLGEQAAKMSEQFVLLEHMTDAEALKDPGMANKLQDLIRRRKLKQMTLGL